MYGKKRIVIRSNNMIILAGGKSWISIGKFRMIEGKIEGKLLHPENLFELKLTPENSIGFNFKKVSEVRKFVKKIYKKEIG